MSTIYEDIIANIDADKKAWCKDDWCSMKDGKPVSRCLVEHIDLAVGTTYYKPNGKLFVSKDPKKWNRRAKLLRNLVTLLPKGTLSFGPGTEEFEMDYSEKHYTKDDMAELKSSPLWRRPDQKSQAEDTLVGFNDRTKTTKAQVKGLLRRAAKRFPED